MRAATPDPDHRAGFEELRRREADFTTAFEERQRRLEERLKEATLWLETKVRETGA